MGDAHKKAGTGFPAPSTSPRRAVVVRVFVKTNQKTPKREIDLALTRAKEVR